MNKYKAIYTKALKAYVDHNGGKRILDTASDKEIESAQTEVVEYHKLTEVGSKSSKFFHWVDPAGNNWDRWDFWEGVATVIRSRRELDKKVTTMNEEEPQEPEQEPQTEPCWICGAADGSYAGMCVVCYENHLR